MNRLSESHRIWLGWVGANALGELVGLGIVFLVGFTIVRVAGEPKSAGAALAFAAAAVALGALEGLVVGYAQWRILGRLLPQAIGRRWVVATVAGAVLAWALGMIPSTVASLSGSNAGSTAEEPSEVLVLLLAAGLGVVGGLVLSFAQWMVLRELGAGAGWWLAANALAWAIGMPWIFWLVGATVGSSQVVTSFAAFIAGLGVAGALVGAIHGAFLVRCIAPKWHVA